MFEDILRRRELGGRGLFVFNLVVCGGLFIKVYAKWWCDNDQRELSDSERGSL